MCKEVARTCMEYATFWRVEILKLYEALQKLFSNFLPFANYEGEAVHRHGYTLSRF